MNTLPFVFAVKELLRKGLSPYIISKILDYNITLIDSKEAQSLKHYKAHSIHTTNKLTFVGGQLIGCSTCFCGEQFRQYAFRMCCNCKMLYCNNCMFIIDVNDVDYDGICKYCNDIYKPNMCYCGEHNENEIYSDCGNCGFRCCSDCIRIDDCKHCNY